MVKCPDDRHSFGASAMTGKVFVACLLIATGVAACSKDPAPEPAVEALPPGDAQPDRPRDVPYQNTYSRYSTDRPGVAPRSGMSSDHNTPNGAPGTFVRH
jgi:hypothetical protein